MLKQPGKTKGNNVHLEWVRCNKRNGARRGGDNRVRSKAGRRVRKSFAFPTPGGSGSRQSAPDATSYQEPSPPENPTTKQNKTNSINSMVKSQLNWGGNEKKVGPARQWASRRPCNILWWWRRYLVCSCQPVWINREMQKTELMIKNRLIRANEENVKTGIQYRENGRAGKRVTCRLPSIESNWSLGLARWTLLGLA